MADAQVLKEFLVLLGYKIDEHSQKKFLDAVAYMTVKVAALGLAVEAAAAATIAGVATIASNMESLYFTSKRVGDSVENINAFAYAVSQMGGTASEARASLEGFAKWLQNPGAMGALHRLGVQTEDPVTHELYKAERLAENVAKVLKTMPIARARQAWEQMQFSQNTMYAMMNGLDHYMEEFRNKRTKLGIDPDESAKIGLGFNRALRNLADTADALKEKLLEAIGPGMTQQLEHLEQLFERNFDKIVAVIKGGATILVNLGEALLQGVDDMSSMFDSLVRWFDTLDPKTQDMLKVTGLLVLAWQALNLEFIRSPLGKVVAALTAIMWLYDDYRKFKETGKSVLDWAKIEPQVEQVWNWLGSADKGLKSATDGVFDLTKAIEGLLALMLGARVFKMLGIFRALGWIAGAGAAAGGGAAAAAAGVGGAAARMSSLALGLGLGSFLTTLLYPKTTNAGEAEELKSLGLGGQPSILNNPGLAEPGTPSSSADPGDPGFVEKLWGWMGNPHMRLQMQSAGIWHPGMLGAERSGDAHKAIEFFRQHGWSLAQAAGLAANIQAESNFNPNARGDNDQAYGIGQWHPDRQALFKQYSGGADIHGSTFEQQLGFYDWELRNSQTQSKANYFMQHSTTPEQGAAAGVMFEGPADTYGAMLSRGITARQYYEENSLKPETPTLNGKQLSMNQTNNITVTGSSDPHDAARRVRQELDRSNADLVRNTRGAVVA